MQRPRGTRDLYGEDLLRIRRVQEGFEEIFKRYGYEEIETPIFENLELFTKKSGSEIVDQIYHFEDKSNRELALRPELTAPSIRFYNNQLKSEPKPLKIFYFGPCFRYERPQAERWRQFLQAGVELIGSERPEADAEVIALTHDALTELGLENYTLKVGHIGLLRKILNEGGVAREGQDPILRAIDSGDEERITEKMEIADVDEDAREKIHQLIELCGDSSVVDEAEGLVEGISGAESVVGNFRNILRRLRQMGVKDCQIDWGIARGLEYYTGSVFEVYFDDVQLGGGGRYDDLIEALGGEPTPAVGVGFGVDRIAIALEGEGEENGRNGLDAILLPTEGSMLKESLKMARGLRRRGFKIDIDLMGRSLSKALSYADSREARYAIIVGPEDMRQGRVTLRDMERGEQERVFREAIPERLRP